MEININIFVLISIFQQILINQVNGACTWPTEFVSTQWYDSARGVLSFGTDSMQGYTLTPTTGIDVSSWDCVSVSTYSTDGRIILITSQSFQLFSTNYYAYLCITVTKVTDSSHRYYINHEIQGNINNERLFIYPVSTLTDQGTICSNTGATGGEYQMLIKAGSESGAKLDCPWYFLGIYGYIHTTFDGSTTCDVTSSQLNMCTDTQQMTFDYSNCSTKVAYSVSDTVWCVGNVPEGETNFLMLFNGNDADSDVDNELVYKFTCMAVSGDVASASVSPKHCQSGQVSDQYPTSTTGVSMGALLSFTAATATCPTLTAPVSGNVSVSTTGSATSALYACGENYTLWGTSTRTCETDAWTDTAPSCNCAAPLTPSNGAVAVNSDGTVSTYTCHVDYSLNGVEIRICESSTATWTDSDPSCVLCDSLADITGQTPSRSSNGTVTSVSFVCVSGYTLRGESSLHCTENGTWNNQQPDCVSCPTLTNPASGTVTLTTDGSTTIATYACASGYTLQGATTRTCQLNETWDNSQPQCLCNPPNSPSNGAVVADGSEASYTCNVGFSLSGEKTRTCQTDGTVWSTTDPQCSECNSLPTVTGGSYVYTTSTTVTSAKYTCLVGYSLEGVSTITCKSDGFWSSTSPNCVVCPTLKDPSSGTVTLSTSGTKTSATYACASGYNLIGNTIRLCNSDGTWSLMQPTCTCTSPAIPAKGSVTDDGATATYACDLGYSLNGQVTRSCGMDGTGWNASNPTCGTCDTLSSPTGGTVALDTDGINTQASYTCYNGYTLNGVSRLTCTSDATWDYAAPTCAKCPDLSDPDSGTLSMITTGSATTATFGCQSGYYLNGAFTLTCGADELWSADPPTCKCNFPAQPSNGGVSVSGTGTVATYSCDTGYSLDGLSDRVCQTDGTEWESANPNCTVCQTVSNPSSGLFTLSSNVTHTTVKYFCDVGTTMGGQREIVCTSDGSWESSPPTCVECSTPDDPGSGSVTLSTNTSTTIATYTCVTGYTLNATDTRTCTTTGEWDIFAPYCICDSPPLISNGELTISTNLRSAEYTCDVGYVLVGSHSRSCRDDGTGWDGIDPICDMVDTGVTMDTSNWSIPIAVMVFIMTMLVVLVILLSVSIHLYCRLRQERSSRVASAVSRETEDPSVVEERHPELFSVPKPTGEKATLQKKYQNTMLRPPSSLTMSSVKFANGLTLPHSTVTSQWKVELPPISHICTEKKRKKKKPIGDNIPEQKQTSHRESRSATSIKERMTEIGIERVMTPDLLSTVEFNYIKPVYSYELEDDTGRHTVLSRKGNRIKTKKKRKQDIDVEL